MNGIVWVVFGFIVVGCLFFGAVMGNWATWFVREHRQNKRAVEVGNPSVKSNCKTCSHSSVCRMWVYVLEGNPLDHVEGCTFYNGDAETKEE